MTKNVLKISAFLLSFAMVICGLYTPALAHASDDEDSFDWDTEYSVNPNKKPDHNQETESNSSESTSDETNTVDEDDTVDEDTDTKDDKPKKPRPFQPIELPPAAKNYKHKLHKYDPKKYKRTPTQKEILKYYDKLKKELGGIKPKRLKFNLDYDGYDLKFTDVSKDHKYRKEIIWAAANGIIKNEKKPFRPDDLITAGEFTEMYWELSAKYHLVSRDDLEQLSKSLTKKSYDGMQPIADKSNATPRDFIIAWSSSPSGSLLVPTESLLGEKNYPCILHKGVCVPERIMDYGDLLRISSAAYYAGISDPPSGDEINTEDERRTFVLNIKNASEIFSSTSIHNYFIPSSEIKKRISRKNVSYSPLHGFAVLPYRLGIAYMQKLGRIKKDPTVKDLQLNRKITRAEMLDFLYDLTKLVKDRGEELDLDIDYRIGFVK